MQVNLNISLGFDYGTKYIGIAVGQKISNTAFPLVTLQVSKDQPNWQQITKLIKEWNPGILLVGLPLNMDGTMQPIAVKAKNFAIELEHRFKLKVQLIDERLSTWEAKQQLKLNKGTFTKQELTKINAMAAVIITEQWLQNESKPTF